MALLPSLLGASLPLVPKPVVRRVARPYVAGEVLDEAMERVKSLQKEGFLITLALLGEEVEERERTLQAVEEYLEIVRRFGTRIRGGADGQTEGSPHFESGISIKLTLLGLKIDRGLCRENLFQVVDAAMAAGVLVRIDMEDHTCTDATLELFGEVVERQGGVGRSNAGVALQAYLRRTEGDILALPAGANVRLCKGIYLESERVAFRDSEKIRSQFLIGLEKMFDQRLYVGIATHDRFLVDGARRLIGKRGLATDCYEFQTLLGVSEVLRDELRDEGHTVRVYVPYGRDWYLYSVRRLRENPQIAVHVLRAFFGLE